MSLVLYYLEGMQLKRKKVTKGSLISEGSLQAKGF